MAATGPMQSITATNRAGCIHPIMAAWASLYHGHALHKTAVWLQMSMLLGSPWLLLLSMLGPCAHATADPALQTPPPSGARAHISSSHLRSAQKDDPVLRHGSSKAHGGRPPVRPRRGPARRWSTTRGAEIDQHGPHTFQLPLWQFTRCQAPICTASYAVRSYSVYVRALALERRIQDEYYIAHNPQDQLEHVTALHSFPLGARAS